MALEVASNVDGTNYERSHSEGDITILNVTKSKQRSVSIAAETDNSTADGGSTQKESNRTSTNPVMRRRSTLKGVATGITGFLKLRRLTIPSTKSFSVKPKIKYENTYKMSPDAGQRITTSKIEQVAEQILAEEIGCRKYNSFEAGNMACTISAKIKSTVKEMNFPRYRIVCQVIITQVMDQGIEAASRCLWDTRCDNYTTVYYKNESIAAVAMLYGVYFE